MRASLAMLALVPILAVLVTACASTVGAGVNSASPPAEILSAAQAAAAEGDYAAAHKGYELLLDNHASAREAGDAGWGMAEMSYRLEEWDRAKTEYEEYHETHPLGHLSELEERMYDIGRKLYGSGSRGLLGLGIFSSIGRSTEAMTFVADELQSGSRADDALLFLGKTSILADKFEMASDFFSLLLERYPESEWALEARFFQGWSYWLVNWGSPYDLRSLLRARQTFTEYVRLVEKDPARRTEYAERTQEAKLNLQEIDATLAEKNLLIARWYLAQERPESARGYLERTTRDYPDSDAASEARELMSGAETGR